MAAKRNMELAQRRERELLYASFSTMGPRSGASSPGGGATTPTATPAQQQQQQQRRTAGRPYKSATEVSKEDRVLGASDDVTRSLRQAHDLMAAELSRSDFAHRTLRESTRALAELSESYAGLDGLLSASRDLLGTLLRSRKSDTWYLETSLWLLLATVAWLVFRRWLYGPLWWLLWLPLKLLFRGAVGVSGSVARRASGPGSAEMQSSASSVPQQARMNNEGAPTIRVNPESTPSPSSQRPEGQEESVAEGVGRIIDQSREDAPAEPQAAAAAENNSAEDSSPGSDDRGETVLRERTEDEPPNPKKRMMEGEPPGSNDDHGHDYDRETQQGRAKDEL